MIRYIAKPNTWFEEQTEAKLVEFHHEDENGIKYGLFEGVKRRNENLLTEARICSYEDFEEVDL